MFFSSISKSVSIKLLLRNASFFCRAEKDREIRNEQDRAFQETLRIDQERERRIAKEVLRREVVAVEEERKRQEEERVRKAELDR